MSKTAIAKIGSDNISTSQVSVTGSVTLIAAARTGMIGTGRSALTIYNSGSSTIYVGNSGVTTANGIPVAAGAAISLDTTAAVYGIVSSGTCSAAVLETY